jgi:hypothetical protein
MLAVGVVVVPGGSARACSCMTFTVDSALAGGVAAFVGTPQAVIDGASAGQETYGPRGWQFEVEAVVKGDLPDQVEVWQSAGGACGPTFTVRRRVGVVLRREGDRYVTDDCGGVWLADELLHPGALAAPSGQAPVSLIAAGRSGPAMLAAYDVDGNLAAWGLGEPADEMSHLAMCPGSTTFVGIAGWDQPRLVRRDVASLGLLSAVVLPERTEGSWPMITDPRALQCVSPDGDVMLLVSASGYGDGGTDNVVVWIDGDAASVHRVDHGWGLAATPDGTSAILLAGRDGTDVERLTLADGSRQLITRLPDGLGGRLVAVEPDSGRLAVIATTNPTLHSRGDPAAPDNRLVVLDADGAVQSVAELGQPQLADSVEWVDAQHVRVERSLPATAIEVIGLDGSVQTTVVESTDLTIVGGRVYAATPTGVTETGPDGHRRLLAPGIARVNALVAVPNGPTASPQPVPTTPTTVVPTTEPAAVVPTTPTTGSSPPPATSAPSAPASTSPAAAAIDDPTDEQDDLAMAGVAAIIAIVIIGGVVAVFWWRRRRAVTA